MKPTTMPVPINNVTTDLPAFQQLIGFGSLKEWVLHHDDGFFPFILRALRIASQGKVVISGVKEITSSGVKPASHGNWLFNSPQTSRLRSVLTKV